MTKDWIQAHPSGLKLFPLDPARCQFRWTDIACALSMQCRYGGHVDRFYSVAEHSVLVSRVAESRARLAGLAEDVVIQLARIGLLHDASEYILGDVPRPLKHTPVMAGYRAAEQAMQAAIMRWAGLPEEEPELIRRIDTEILGTEARQLKQPLHPDWGATCPGGELPATISMLPRLGLSARAAELAFIGRASVLGLLR